MQKFSMKRTSILKTKNHTRIKKCATCFDEKNVGGIEPSFSHIHKRLKMLSILPGLTALKKPSLANRTKNLNHLFEYILIH